MINLAYLGQQISDYLGDGSRYQANITYSNEGDTGLETAGGIKKALPLLGNQPFLVINADISCNFPLQQLRHQVVDLAHLVLINNPEHHLKGDFSCDAQGILHTDAQLKYTFSGIGVYHPQLFANIDQGKSALAPLLKTAIQTQRVTGEVFQGHWMDIGTVERLHALEKQKTDA